MTLSTGHKPLIFGLIAMFVALALPSMALLIVNHLSSPDIARTWLLTRFIAWLASIAAFACILAAIGIGLKQRLLGVLINERNRYSLSRLQMVLWTALLLPSIYVVLLNNLYQPGPPDATFNFDWQLLALMGISVGSVVTTPMVLSLKSDPKPSTIATLPGPAAAGSLDANVDATEAAIGDLVLGEETGNAAMIDIGRIQMLLISMMAVVVYGWSLGHGLLTDELHIDRMPTFSETLLGLILVSHAGYLVGKVTPTADSKSQTATELARVLLLSQKATDLATRGEQAARNVVANSAQDRQVSTLLPLIRSLATEAAALTAQFGKDTYDTLAIGRLEGKCDALTSQLATITDHPGTDDSINAPKPDLIRDVQRRLAAGNFAVSPSGIADAGTFSAIDRFLGDRKLTRADFSPEPYRLFEELQGLMKIQAR